MENLVLILGILLLISIPTFTVMMQKRQQEQEHEAFLKDLEERRLKVRISRVKTCMEIALVLAKHHNCLTTFQECKEKMENDYFSLLEDDLTFNIWWAPHIKRESNPFFCSYAFSVAFYHLFDFESARKKANITKEECLKTIQEKIQKSYPAGYMKAYFAVLTWKKFDLLNEHGCLIFDSSDEIKSDNKIDEEISALFDFDSDEPKSNDNELTNDIHSTDCFGQDEQNDAWEDDDWEDDDSTDNDWKTDEWEDDEWEDNPKVSRIKSSSQPLEDQRTEDCISSLLYTSVPLDATFKKASRIINLFKCHLNTIFLGNEYFALDIREGWIKQLNDILEKNPQEILNDFSDLATERQAYIISINLLLTELKSGKYYFMCDITPAGRALCDFIKSLSSEAVDKSFIDQEQKESIYQSIVDIVEEYRILS